MRLGNRLLKIGIRRDGLLIFSDCPWIIGAACDPDELGTKYAVVRPAMATPKLMDICCTVLAMELALLVCASVVSAYTSVLMLVYCRDENAP